VENGEIVLENVVSDIGPLFYIISVEPTHLGVITLGISVILKVREYDIVVEVVAIHTDKIQEYIMVVSVTVYYDCGASCVCRVCCRNIAGVNPVSVKCAVYSGIFEDAESLEAVIPGSTAGKQ